MLGRQQARVENFPQENAHGHLVRGLGGAPVTSGAGHTGLLRQDPVAKVMPLASTPIFVGGCPALHPGLNP